MLSCNVLIAKFFKHWGHKWYVLHAGLNSFAAVLTLIAVILLIATLTTPTLISPNPLAVAHAVSGLIIVVSGSIIQPILGKVADLRWRPDRVSVPVFPDKVHWFLGRGVSLLALVNVIIGIILFGALWIAIVSLVLCSYIGIAVYMVSNPPPAKTKTEQRANNTDIKGTAEF